MTAKQKRMADELDMLVEGIRRDVSEMIKKDITHIDAQKIIARSTMKPIIIVATSKKKKPKLSDIVF